LKSKTIKITAKDLDEATRTGSELKIRKDKQLEEIIDNSPDLGVQINDRGLPTEIILMKALKRKGKISASWCFNNLKIPYRTAGYSLLRLKNKGYVTYKTERVRSISGAFTITNVFSMTEKGKSWITNLEKMK